ncbi:MAG: hypothetical protein EXS05_12440 [Planctomycetaceae bacterium]|nr:hypothetical protein [Planctomycetaceae bacterium]
MNPHQTFTFEPFRLDRDDAQLFCGAEAVPLTPKAFDVLLHLVANARRLVTKQELQQAVWKDAYVGDGSLKVCVREIRLALGDDARSPRFIETVHRRGYRFLVGPQVARPPSASPPSSSPQTAPGIAGGAVGRRHELHRLGELLAAAMAGERQVAFITGEPGSGKTTLLKGFLQDALRGGARVAVGQCFARFGVKEAYGPVLEAIGALCRDPRHAALPGLLGQHAPTWLVQMPGITAAAGRAGLSREVLGATSQRMQREGCDAIEALSAEVPLVLVLEDLHWSDHASVELVSALAQRRGPARLLLVATYRPCDVNFGDHPIQSVKQQILARRAGCELPLGGLAESEIAEYLAHRYHGAQLPPALAGWLLGRTSGNPLFVVDLIDDWEFRGVLRRTGDQWELRGKLAERERDVPANVRSLVEERVRRLGDGERRVLEATSVAGSEFASAAVAAALDADELEVEACCDALARRHLILKGRGESAWPDGTVSGRYGFNHELYRDVVYERIPPARRARLHFKLGQRLEAGHTTAVAEVAAELAMHFELARDPERAAAYLEQAAVNAARRFANREALGYLDRAIDLTGRKVEPGREPARLALLERRGLLRRAGNNLAGATADFIALADGARRLGRIDKELDALFYQASAASWIDREACLAASDAASQIVSRSSDPLLLANTRGRSAYWNLLWREWNADDAGAIALAVAAARCAGDRTMLAQHAARHAHFLTLNARYDEACATAAEAAQLALEGGDASEYLLCRFYQAWALLYAGNWGKMLQTLDAAAEVSDRNDHRRWSLLIRLERAWLHEQAFDFDGALGLCDGVLREAPALGLTYAESLGLILRGFAHLGVGHVNDARRDFKRIGELLDEGPRLFGWFWRLPVHLGLAECHLAQGELQEAHREAQRLCALAAGPGEQTYLALGRRLLAEVALRDGTRNERERALAAMRAAVEGADLQLASWRVDATAMRVLQSLRQPSGATAAAARRDAALERLGRSLPAGHPLGETLAAGALEFKSPGGS